MLTYSLNYITEYNCRNTKMVKFYLTCVVDLKKIKKQIQLIDIPICVIKNTLFSLNKWNFMPKRLEYIITIKTTTSYYKKKVIDITSNVSSAKFHVYIKFLNFEFFKAYF